MKSSECPGMFSEDEPANTKLRAESTSGWEHLKEAHWTVLDCVLQMRVSELCSSAMSKDFTLSLQAIIQILLTEMKASGTCDDSEPFQKTSQNFAELAKYQPKPMSLCPQSFPPHLCSVPSPNGDKTIMTQLAATQLSHCSIMSENEIDLKILRRPRLEQKGLLCWLY